MQGRFWRLLGVVVAVMAAACGNGEGAGSTPGGGVFRFAIAEPAAIDPYTAWDLEGILVAKAVFEGLLTLDPDTTRLRPGVAETWSHNADCTQWTFSLRRGTRFSNAEEVTARSFIRGMTRAARKEAASDVAYYMAGIAGFTELQGGKQKTFSGLSAPESFTLRVTLSAADCEFDYKTAHPVMSPVPRVAREAAEEDRAFHDLPIGNGPFRMAGPWRHDHSISLVRNETYYGEKPSLEGIELSILPPQGQEEVEYRGFEAGLFDFAVIPAALLPQAKGRYGPTGGFIEKETLGIHFLRPNVINPPLQSPEGRKAISLAIDRDAIIEGVFQGFRRKATSLVPPLLDGYHQPGVCNECGTSDVAQARRLADQAGLRHGTKLNLAYPTGSGHDIWVQAVAQQLRDNLGLRVELQPFPFQELSDKEEAPGASGLFRSGWSADYPTAENFLFPLLSRGAGDNVGGYDNPVFDELLARARKTPDEQQRRRLVQEAERLAITEDLALIPLWYRTQYRVFDASRWEDVRLDLFGNLSLTQIRRK